MPLGAILLASRRFGAPLRRAGRVATPALFALAFLLQPGVPARAQPANPELLESHLAAGRLVAARGGYLDLALGTGQERMFSSAVLGLARVTASSGEPEASAALARVAQRHLDVQPTSSRSERERLHYLRGVALRDSGDLTDAIVEMRHARALNGTLAPVAQLRTAQFLAAAGRHAEAVAPFRLAADDWRLTTELRTIAAIEGARALRWLDRDAEALELLDPVASGEADSALQRIEAAWEAVAIRRGLGDALWIDQALSILEVAPGSSVAAQALDALDAEGVAVPPLTAAFVYYRSFRNAEATAVYESVIAGEPSPPDAHVAWFYLGALAERDLLNEDAVVAYENALAAEPEGRLAPDAHWWAGLVLEWLGRHPEATAHFDALATSFPNSRFTKNAIVHSALTVAGSGDLESARARLFEATQTQEGETAATAARWYALLAGSDVPTSVTDAPDPGAFDSASLAAMLHWAGGEPTLPPAAAAEWREPQADWPAAEAWLVARFGPRNLADSALDEARTRIALALAGVDERDVARGFLRAVAFDYRQRPHDLIDLARTASSAGLHDVSMSAAARVLDMVDLNEQLDTPEAILGLVYPLAYGAEMRAAAAAEGIPPLLLAAVVRQESAFNPKAGSVAGALGLTQVIAPTGEAIAASLGLPWDVADLFRPEQSLRYGAHYLAAQLAAHEGHLFAALAAYNAGPGNASRWLDSQTWPGADGFVHIVDFAETSAYLEHVIENYGWYRYIYAGAEAPSFR